MREALSVSEECVCIYNCEVYFVFVSLSVMGRYFALRHVYVGHGALGLLYSGGLNGTGQVWCGNWCKCHRPSMFKKSPRLKCCRPNKVPKALCMLQNN